MLSHLLNARALLAASFFVSTEETRYYLQGVNVKPSASGARIAATDGTALIVIRDAGAVVSAEQTIMLPKEFLAAARKYHNKGGALRLAVYARPDQNSGIDAALFYFPDSVDPTDKDTRAAVELQAAAWIVWRGFLDFNGGTYPEYDRVVPRNVKPLAPAAAINPRLLARVADANKYLTGTNDAGSLAIHPGEEPSWPVLVGMSAPDAFAVVMGMSKAPALFNLPQDKAGIQPPAWLDEPAAPPQIDEDEPAAPAAAETSPEPVAAAA